MVYVDDPAKIPAKFRKSVKEIDLSSISLNQELGYEISQQVEKENLRLKTRAIRPDTDMKKRVCVEVARDRSIGEWLKLVWQDHGYLIIIAGFLFSLLGITPYVLKRIEPERWIRVLMFVLPLMTGLALITYSVASTSQSIRRGNLSSLDCSESITGEELETPAFNLRELRSLMEQIEKEQAPIIKNPDEK